MTEPIGIHLPDTKPVSYFARYLGGGCPADRASRELNLIAIHWPMLDSQAKTPTQ
jgi:hypothetical protein